MNNFNLYVPTRVLFGQGQIASLAKQVPAGSRVLALGDGLQSHRKLLADMRACMPAARADLISRNPMDACPNPDARP